MIKIPDDKIEMVKVEAEAFAHDQVFDRNKFREKLTQVGIDMARFGYDLAANEIAELKKQVERVTTEIKRYARLLELCKEFKTAAEKQALENHAAKMSVESEKDMKPIHYLLIAIALWVIRKAYLTWRSDIDGDEQ